MANTPLFVVRLDNSLRARVKAAAFLRGCTESEIVRDLVRRARPEDLVDTSPALVGTGVPSKAEADAQRLTAA